MPQRPSGPTLTWKEKQALAAQQAQQALQQARGLAGAGVFIDADLEALRTLGGDALMRPIERQGAPRKALVGGVEHDVADLAIEQGTPEFWVRYLFDEIINDESKKALTAFTGRALLLDFYNRVFLRPDDFETRRYAIPRHGSVRAAYPPGNAGDVLLRSHLRAALDLGFDWMQWPADASGAKQSSLVASIEYMMEIQKKTVHTPLVWRTEDRRTMRELRTPGFTQQVTVDHRIKTLGMDQEWNPYSTQEVRGRLWYRRQNTDNCLYTGISVATNPYASIVFPKITLSPTSLAPVANAVLGALAGKKTVESALLEPNGEVKAPFAPYVARLELPNHEFKLVLYSRARTILMALEGKYLDTGKVQGLSGESFPEYGSLGIAGENIFAQVEFHRFFHSWRDDEGFTAFVNVAGCDIVSREAIVDCFHEAKAQTEYFAKVNTTYQNLVTGGPYGLTWAATGVGYNNVTPLHRNAVAAWVEGRRLTLR
ncbi:hypothetical protein [Roseisolibacter agri]|uniref:Uncharacterized protein n=1 Tax=Roseisolibacter agri TaxID=2014610 RepID=A0AA37VEX6_9BACT|nr:hypothetical protein [Roseisolibacter agri]GLC25949.1 hypothetical protein rosag_24620 [Roseisolibacter agri]